MGRNCDSRASLFSLRLNFPFCHIPILHLMCHSHKNSRALNFLNNTDFMEECSDVGIIHCIFTHPHPCGKGMGKWAPCVLLWRLIFHISPLTTGWGLPRKSEWLYWAFYFWVFALPQPQPCLSLPAWDASVGGRQSWSEEAEQFLHIIFTTIYSWAFDSRKYNPQQLVT